MEIPAEATKRGSKFSCSLPGAPQVCGCWGSCSEVKPVSKAAGNAGEQHTHSVVPPGTSPESLGSWIHLVVVGEKKKKQLYIQGKSKSLCLAGVAA